MAKYEASVTTSRGEKKFFADTEDDLMSLAAAIAGAFILQKDETYTIMDLRRGEENADQPGDEGNSSSI